MKEVKVTVYVSLSTLAFFLDSVRKRSPFVRVRLSLGNKTLIPGSFVLIPSRQGRHQWTHYTISVPTQSPGARVDMSMKIWWQESNMSPSRSSTWHIIILLYAQNDTAHKYDTELFSKSINFIFSKHWQSSSIQPTFYCDSWQGSLRVAFGFLSYRGWWLRSRRSGTSSSAGGQCLSRSSGMRSFATGRCRIGGWRYEVVLFGGGWEFLRCGRFCVSGSSDGLEDKTLELRKPFTANSQHPNRLA